MTHHDVAMSRFSQWWKRSVRCGYAYAMSAWMHGNGSERYCLKPVSLDHRLGFAFASRDPAGIPPCFQCGVSSYWVCTDCSG